MPSTGQTIIDELRSHVLDGTLAPGSRLIELQLADEYNVSRAAIRSAISELAKEGLVDREANLGAKVRRVALEEAIQITEIRALLETLVASRAAVKATEPERLELAAILDEMSVAVADDRLMEYSELNGRLHERIREIGRHPVARDLIVNLRNRAKHHEFRLALMPGRAAESLAQHSEIVQAIVTGDAEQAGQAMREHLDSVIMVLRRWETSGARI